MHKDLSSRLVAMHKSASLSLVATTAIYQLLRQLLTALYYNIKFFIEPVNFNIYFIGNRKMDLKENTYDEHAETLSKSANLLDSMIEQIMTKTTDIDGKISVLLKKVNLKLEDSTQFLILQKTILNNEMDYLRNVKTIISTNIKAQLLCLAENIAMFMISVQSIYREIPNAETKHAVVSQKKDPISKIIIDINTNLNAIRAVLLDFNKFNKQFTDDIQKGNFHCLTLSSDMRTVYTHIYLEYTKYVTDMDHRMNYYNDFAVNILEQVPDMRICNYYLPPDCIATVHDTASEIASAIRRASSSAFTSPRVSSSGDPEGESV